VALDSRYLSFDAATECDAIFGHRVHFSMGREKCAYLTNSTRGEISYDHVDIATVAH